MGIRPTIRVRLTALYGVSFVLAGAVLVAIEYLLVRAQLQPEQGLTDVVTGSVDEPLGPLPTCVPSLGRDHVVVGVGNVERFVEDSLRALLWQSVLVLVLVVRLAVRCSPPTSAAST